MREGRRREREKEVYKRKGREDGKRTKEELRKSRRFKKEQKMYNRASCMQTRANLLQEEEEEEEGESI